MKKLFLLIIAIAFLWSCQKDDNTTTKVSYLPLEIGNYWIYQYIEIDTSGNESAMPQIDSVVISRDTIINHKKYYVFEGTNYPYTYRGYWGIVDILRDSSGYIVNQNGFIRFAENDFTDTLACKVESHENEILYTITYQMVKTNNAITIPAGTFGVLNYKGTVVTSLNTPGINYPRYLNCYYAKEVGNVLYTYFYINSPKYFEKRLLRYNVKK